jgi:UDP-2,4-diacetamido-2,4,6-trideoxy-beta-L-altropyranose hydrolase
VNKPLIVLRADASPSMGGGHVMRCLAIAEALIAAGARVAFASGPESLAAAPALARAELRSPEPDAGPRVVLLDGYHLGLETAEAWARVGAVVAVLDDAPERPRPCALRIDPTPGRSEADYAVIAPGARLLLGPAYAPMRQAFPELRPAALARRARGGPVQVVLVSTGLTDAAGLAPLAAQAALDACPQAAVDVLIGSGAASLSELRALAADQRRLTLHVDAEDVAALTAGADLAVGAAGVSAWERCALGLPSVVLLAAANQQANAAALRVAGAAALVDGPEAVGEALAALASDGAARVRMAQAAAALCDGRGAERIAEALLGLVRPR